MFTVKRDSYIGIDDINRIIGNFSLVYELPETVKLLNHSMVKKKLKFLNKTKTKIK